MFFILLSVCCPEHYQRPTMITQGAQRGQHGAPKSLSNGAAAQCPPPCFSGRKFKIKIQILIEFWILNLEFWILNLKSWNLIQDSEAEAEARARNLDACVENGAPNPQKCFPNGFQSSKFWSQIGQNGPGMGTKWPRRPQMAHSRAQIRFLGARDSEK